MVFQNPNYENGQLKSKKNFKDNKQNRLWNRYFDDGQLKFKINDKDGKEDCLYYFYY